MIVGGVLAIRPKPCVYHKTKVKNREDVVELATSRTQGRSPTHKTSVEGSNATGLGP